MIYLASPYTNPDPEVRAGRAMAATMVTAELLSRGAEVFSPIVYSRALADFGLPTDWGFWAGIDTAFLEICEALWILELDGWRVSVGVQDEYAAALARRIPVRFVFQPRRDWSPDGGLASWGTSIWLPGEDPLDGNFDKPWRGLPLAPQP